MEEEIIFNILQQLDNDDLDYNPEMAQENRIINTQLGYSIDVDGDILVVGAPKEIYENDSSGSLYNIGSVYVFEKSSDGQWVKAQRIVPTYKFQNGRFGTSVLIEGDTMLIGAGSYSGAFLGNDTNGNPIFTHPSGEYQGEGGVVFVFVKQGDTWVEQQQLYPSDYSLGGGAPNSTLLTFGSSGLDMSGDNIIVSDVFNSKVYIFNRIGTVWSEVKKIDDFEYVSYDVGISGDYAAVSDLGVDDTGVVRIYNLSSGEWDLHQTLAPTVEIGSYGGTFGWLLAIEENNLAINYLHDNSLRIYNLSNNIWTPSQNIVLGDYQYNSIDDLQSLSIDGRTLIVGLPSTNHTEDNITTNNVGSVQVYTQYPEESWYKIQEILPSSEYLDNGNFGFGRATAISGNELVIGAIGLPYNSTNIPGESKNPVFIYERDISPEEEPDNRPDSFIFPITRDVPINTVVESNLVFLENFDNSIEVVISGNSTGEFRINMGSWGTTGSVSSGDTLQLRVTSNDNPGNRVIVNINIGRYSTNWQAVSAVNAVPVVVMPTPETVLEVGKLVNIPLKGIFSDVESASFTYTAEPLPTSLSVMGDAIVGTPTWNDIGETEITITGIDEHGGIATDDFLMIIRTPITALESELANLRTQVNEQKQRSTHMIQAVGTLYLQNPDGTWNDLLHVGANNIPNSNIESWKSAGGAWNGEWVGTHVYWYLDK